MRDEARRGRRFRASRRSREGAAVVGVQDRAHGDAGESEDARRVDAGGHRADPSQDLGAGGHDVGRRRRSRSGRGLGAGLGPGARLRDGDPGREVRDWVWPAFQEGRSGAFRSYYEYVPKGSFTVEYTVRFNNAGSSDAATRVEAMYSPEMFGEIPLAPVEVKP